MGILLSASLVDPLLETDIATLPVWYYANLKLHFLF